jgi:hypothetical protein
MYEMHLALSFKSGCDTDEPDPSVPLALARAPPLSLFVAGPGRQRHCTFAPCAPLCLCRGTALSGPSSLQTIADPCARMPRKLAMSTAHLPQLPFDPCSHPLSLPCLISPTLSPSRAQPLQLELAGAVRPPCRPPRAPDATPSIPECRPEVRNVSSCSGCLDFALL